jgi:hypothetical protein
MTSKLKPAVEAGDSIRVWALEGYQEDVAEAVAVEAAAPPGSAATLLSW